MSNPAGVWGGATSSFIQRFWKDVSWAPFNPSFSPFHRAKDILQEKEAARKKALQIVWVLVLFFIPSSFA